MRGRGSLLALAMMLPVLGRCPLGILPCGLGVLFGVTLLTMGTVDGWAQSERVVWRYRPDEEVIRFQVQNIRGEIADYQVAIYELRSKQKVATLSSFHSTQLKHVFEADWKPEAESGVFVQKLIVAGDEAPAQLEDDDIPAILTKESPMSAVNAELDRREKLVRWELPRAAIVRATVGFRSGLPLARPMSWRFAPAGRGQYPWDFVGIDGMDYLSHPELRAYVQLFPIPSEVVIWGLPDWEDYRQLPAFGGFEAGDRRLNFSFHPLTEDAEQEKDEGGWRVPYQPGLGLRVELDEETQRFVTGKRFEILIYLNGAFIHEESQGVSPYTFALPESLNGVGTQLLTAYVLEYGGNWGIQTITLDFQTEKNDPKKDAKEIQK